MRDAFLALLTFVVSCGACTPRITNPDIGPYRTPIHAYGFVSCTGNTPIAWLRSDAVMDPRLRIGVLAHEIQHVLDFTNAGGCIPGYAAYVENPLHFEARAYCAGFRAQLGAGVIPSIEQEIRFGAPFIAQTLREPLADVTAALTAACFVQTYP
jgi:hypothetical protein